MRRDAAALAARDRCCASLAGCSSVPRERPPVQPPVDPAALAGVTLRVGDQKGGSQSLLRRRGPAGHARTSIEWSTFTSGPPLIEAARAGAIDVGNIGNTPVIFAAAARARVQLVAASQGNVVSDAMLVLPGVADAATSPSCAGARSRWPRAARRTASCSTRCAGRGSRSTTWTSRSSPPPTRTRAFKQGQVDAWAVWDPYTAQAQLETGARTLADRGGHGQRVLVLRREQRGPGRPGAPGRRRRPRPPDRRRPALLRHPPRAAGAGVVGGDEAAPAGHHRRDRPAGPTCRCRWTTSVVRSQQELADAFSDAGVIPGRVRFADIVDRRFEAHPEMITPALVPADLRRRAHDRRAASRRPRRGRGRPAPAGPRLPRPGGARRREPGLPRGAHARPARSARTRGSPRRRCSARPAACGTWSRSGPGAHLPHARRPDGRDVPAPLRRPADAQHRHRRRRDRAAALRRLDRPRRPLRPHRRVPLGPARCLGRRADRLHRRALPRGGGDDARPARPDPGDLLRRLVGRRAARRRPPRRRLPHLGRAAGRRSPRRSSGCASSPPSWTASRGSASACT